MIELRDDSLVFDFPEVHPQAKLRLDFQRTLRIPDDGEDYPLPPGLGSFPLRHVDDFSERVPNAWLRHGGIMLPMYQSEALWVNFSRASDYPFAVKVAAGKINAVTGEAWEDALSQTPQDYMVVPRQPWLDGYSVEDGLIRQFVAMPLGSGYSAEEQLTGEAEHGGLQIVAYPMKAEAYERMVRRRELLESTRSLQAECYPLTVDSIVASPDMALAPGGRMRQKIYDDPHRFSDWETDASSRCFVHLANSMVWRAVSGKLPPTVPPTATEYTDAGLPWFEYYAADAKALEGSSRLGGLKSVVDLGNEKGDVPLPENVSVQPEHIVHLRKGLKDGQVREGMF